MEDLRQLEAEHFLNSRDLLHRLKTYQALQAECETLLLSDLILFKPALTAVIEEIKKLFQSSEDPSQANLERYLCERVCTLFADMQLYLASYQGGSFPPALQGKVLKKHISVFTA